ncbi:Shr3p RNJ42_02203 [Nakaseomyces bracarensis]|uniref:Shr3p n=1 Tax=Nakaseomyces bracarensis TaxID=273131 RepID=UPI0038723D86
MLSYAEFCTIGSAMILTSTTFLMGVFFACQPYDFHLLFDPKATQEHFDLALKHYQVLSTTPMPIIYLLGFVVAIGVLGNTIRIYKPNPELSMFEYASLGLFVLAVCVFITNIKTGIECSVTGNWGEVSQNQGLAVIASSNIILLVMLFGVILLQIGLWYTNNDYQKRLNQFYEEERKEEAVKSKKKQEEFSKLSKKQQKKAMKGEGAKKQD